ncbi:MAG: pentapeptide repeat-containing protein, partial [Pseudomonadota bacterium]
MVNDIEDKTYKVALDQNTDDLKIARVNALTRSGRANWFGLLAYLAFTMVTLLGVQDADFFIAARETQLPLIGVSIPTGAFFIAAPILGAALHIYLHLFVRKSTKALMDAPPEHNGERLETHVLPWLLNDLILRWRGVAEKRPLDGIATVTAILLIWIAGPFVLGYAWWRSWPAHDPVMSYTALGCFLAASYASLASGFQMLDDLKICTVGRERIEPLWLIIVMLTPSAYPVLQSTLNTPAQLSGVAFSSLPPEIADHDTARAMYREEWCRRQGLTKLTCGPVPGGESFPKLPEFRAAWCSHRGIETDQCTEHFAGLDRQFDRDWTQLRSARIKALPKSDLSGRDLRGAQLDSADLTGVRFSAKEPFWPWQSAQPANLEGANLIGARLEGAWFTCDENSLREATLSGASEAELQKCKSRAAKLQYLIASNSNLKGANLSLVGLEGADLSYARLEGADLSYARLEGADLVEARLEGADLKRARLEGADLVGATLEGADLFEARLEGADLFGATLEGADLRRARLEGADLSYA